MDGHCNYSCIVLWLQVLIVQVGNTKYAGRGGRTEKASTQVMSWLLIAQFAVWTWKSNIELIAHRILDPEDWKRQLKKVLVSRKYSERETDWEDKPARLIIRLSNATKTKQILRQQCCLRLRNEGLISQYSKSFEFMFHHSVRIWIIFHHGVRIWIGRSCKLMLQLLMQDPFTEARVQQFIDSRHRTANWGWDIMSYYESI